MPNRLSEPSSSVWPSGRALAASSAEMLPLEPGRLSTTTFWPRRSPRGAPTVRAITSVAPPGGNDTMIRIGRFGKDCALATLAVEHSATAVAADSHIRLVVIVSSGAFFLLSFRGAGKAREPGIHHARIPSLPWIPDSRYAAAGMTAEKAFSIALHATHLHDLGPARDLL